MTEAEIKRCWHNLSTHLAGHYNAKRKKKKKKDQINDWSKNLCSTLTL